MLTLVVLLLLSADKKAEPAHKPQFEPNRPSLVNLPAKPRTLGQIAMEINEQTGNEVVPLSQHGPDENQPTYNLATPGPVPFWQALDRVCTEVRLIRHPSTNVGMFDTNLAKVQLQPIFGNVEVPSYAPAQYVGPLRLGQLTIHARFEETFVPTPSIGRDHGPLFAEFDVLAEPRVVALQTAPLKDLQATDDLGRSLLDSATVGERSLPEPFEYKLRAPSVIRIPLVRPETPGHTLKMLKGSMPLEVATRPTEPAVTIPLADSVGKTFEAGDFVVEVKAYRTTPQPSASFTLQGRLKGQRGDLNSSTKGVLYARLMAMSESFMEAVNERGNRIRVGGGSAGVNDQGELTVNGNLFVQPNEKDLPKVTIRLYAPQWITWDAPFAFSDVPLP